MSLLVQRKYVGLLSPRLEQFKRKSSDLWNFRCPLCGDSHKNAHKTRGYIFRKKNHLLFHCHNCGVSMLLGNLVKKLNPSLFKEMAIEEFREKNGGNTYTHPGEDILRTEVGRRLERSDVPVRRPSIDLPTIETLLPNNPARRYLDSRSIPKDFYRSLYYAEDWQAFCDEAIPGHGKKFVPREPRIIIPFYDRGKQLIGFQGRAVGEASIRYITMKLDEDAPKLFGLDRLVLSKRTYAVEGPFDAMFLYNCFATMDAALFTAQAAIGFDVDCTYVFDNQPRNKDVVRNMEKTVDLGYDVCVWPQSVTAKDINDMVLEGTPSSFIQNTIDRHTYTGLRAKLEISKWRKS